MTTKQNDSGSTYGKPFVAIATCLRLFHTLGVQIVQITYNERNLFGNGCLERTDEGLSHIGLAAIREMNQLGILIDLSHVADRTVLETIEHSEQPVVFTHANARFQTDYSRNTTNETIRALTSRGGVIGANAFPYHHRHGYDSTLDDYLDAMRRKGGSEGGSEGGGGRKGGDAGE